MRLSLSPSLSRLPTALTAHSSLPFALAGLSQVGAVLHVEPVALRVAGAALPVAAALIGHLREGVWSDQVPAAGGPGEGAGHTAVRHSSHPLLRFNDSFG